MVSKKCLNGFDFRHLLVNKIVCCCIKTITVIFNPCIWYYMTNKTCIFGQFTDWSVQARMKYGSQLRFGIYTILDWTAHSVNLHIALKAMFYLLNNYQFVELTSLYVLFLFLLFTSLVSHSVPLTPVKYNPYCGNVSLDSYTILNGEP